MTRSIERQNRTGLAKMLIDPVMPGAPKLLAPMPLWPTGSHGMYPVGVTDENVPLPMNETA